jgi:hypothetical protein
LGDPEPIDAAPGAAEGAFRAPSGPRTDRAADDPFRRWGALGLLVIVVLALALRMHGLGFGLPHMTYRDVLVLHTQVKEIRTGDPALRLDGMWGYYPHLTAHFAALFPDTELSELTSPLDLEGHLARAAQPWIALRRASVLLSLLAVVGAYLIARRFVSTGGAWIAASLVAVSLLHLSFSQQEKPHGPVSGTVALALASALWLRERPSPPRILVATVAACAAICTLQNAVFMLGSLAVLWVLWTRERPVPRARLIAAPLLLAALGAAFVRFFYPFHFLASAPHLVREDEARLDLAGHPLFLDRFDFTGVRVVLSTLISYDPTLLLFGLVGIGFFIADRARGVVRDRERERALAVLLGFVLPFLLVLGAYSAKVTFERFLLPAITCFACLAAYGLWRIGRALPASWRRPGVLAPMAALCLAPATLAAWKHSSVRAAPDTWTQAATWLRANVDPADPVYTLPYLDLPLLRREDAFLRSGREVELTPWTNYTRETPEPLRLGPSYMLVTPKPQRLAKAEFGDDPLASLRSAGARYVVIQAPSETSRQKLLVRVREQLAATERLVFRTSPVGDPRKGRGQFLMRHSHALGVKPLALRVFDATAYGSTIEIYSLD